MQRLLGLLSALERTVILWRCEGWTLDQVGAAVGLCKERVRQIERRAILRLRAVAGAETDAPARIERPGRVLAKLVPQPSRLAADLRDSANAAALAKARTD